MMVVIKLDGLPYLCKTDEVGELCVCAGYTGTSYWGLQGITIQTFQVQPLMADGRPLGDKLYVRTGLIGFLGPVSWNAWSRHLYRFAFSGMCTLP